MSLLRLLVVGAALWPLLHMSLVQTRGMSSWKLAGWGMYATPPPIVYYAVRIREQTEDEQGGGKPRWRPFDIKELHRDSGAPLPEVFARRRWLGNLFAADRVAATLLEDVPSALALRVTIETREIDPVSGLVRVRRERGQAARPPESRTRSGVEP